MPDLISQAPLHLQTSMPLYKCWLYILCTSLIIFLI